MDVGLGADIDAETGERRLERGQHPPGGEVVVPVGRAEEPGEIPPAGLVEPDAHALPEEPVDPVDVELLGRVEVGAALVREPVDRHAEAPVQVEVAGGAERLDPRARLLLRAERDGDHVLLGQRHPGRVEPPPTFVVRLVGDHGPEHPEGDALVVHLGLEAGLEVRELLLLGPRQLAQVALTGELPELRDAGGATVGLRPQRLARLERREARVTRVDLLELERLLEAREVAVVLLVELGEEAVGPVAVAVKVDRVRSCHGGVG